MKPVLYEVKRVLTSKAIIALFALIIILPILIAVTSASGPSGSGFYIDSTGYGQGGNGTYNVSVFLYNGQTGVPIQGTQVKISAGNNNITAKTDAAGFVNETFHDLTKSVARNMTYQYSLSSSGSSSDFTGSIRLGSGQENPYFTSTTFQQIVNDTIVNGTYYYPRLNFVSLSVPNHPSLNTLGIQYNPSGLSSVPPVYVYYKALSNSSDTVFNIQELIYTNISSTNRTLLDQPTNPYFASNESQLNYLGESQGSPMMIVNTANLTSNHNTTRYLFEVFSPNGTVLGFTELQLVNKYSVAQVSSIFNTDELPILGIFVPLMAVLSGFTIFGRDKVDGSLNYTIVRPLSRRALISSRFFSNVLAICIPAAISVAISSVVFHYYLGTYIPAETIYLSLWAITVMAAGFTGLVYLASSMMKSLGRVVGTSIGIFLLLDLFWSFPGFPVIPSIVSFSTHFGSLKYAAINVAMDYATPSGFVNLVSYIGNKSVSQPIFLGNFYPSQVGITLPAILIVGIIWIVIPFVLSIVRFSKFD